MVGFPIYWTPLSSHVLIKVIQQGIVLNEKYVKQGKKVCKTKGFRDYALHSLFFLHFEITSKKTDLEEILVELIQVKALTVSIMIVFSARKCHTSDWPKYHFAVFITFEASESVLCDMDHSVVLRFGSAVWCIGRKTASPVTLAALLQIENLLWILIQFAV